MSKSLQELGLQNEPLPAQTYDDLPEFGTFTPPPQPGSYRFTLPTRLSACYDVIPASEKLGQRLKVIFDKDAPLTIVQSPANKLNGDTFHTNLTNVERKRGKDGPEASDLDYLLKALGEKEKPKTNAGYGAALQKHPGQEFGSDIRWSWFCNQHKNIWVVDGSGKRVEVEGTKGCGKRYYQEGQTRDQAAAISKQENGEFPLEISCTCGAVVRAFANLDNIRS